MYAVFEDGSHQYRVSEGHVVDVDFRDVATGTRVEFDRVLLYQGSEGLQIGQPTVVGARVLAEVVDHPTTKHYIQKFRRRKNYRRLRGHRQPFTAVQIRAILVAGQEAPAPASPEPTAKPSSPDTCSQYVVSNE